jgi:hypothetical protein
MNILDKKTLSDLLGVSPDSLRKALERMEIREITESSIPTILNYYSRPAMNRRQETVEAAQKLLEGNINIYVDNRSVTASPDQAPIPPLKTVEAPKVVLKPVETKGVVEFAVNDKVVLALAFSGALAIAFSITAPVFAAVGVNIYWAYVLSVFIDLSAFIFMCRGKYTYGVVMAILTAVQAAFTVGAFDFIDSQLTGIFKGIAVSISIGIVIHGYSAIIANK